LALEGEGCAVVAYREQLVSKIVVLMGAPGAGKGTQASLLSQRFGWPKISTGDILRDLANADSDLGHKVREVQASGQLVSDDVLAEIVRERTSREDCLNGYILDGYPRTLNQAELVLGLAKTQGKKLVVINLAIGRETLIERLSSRLICPQCAEIYNDVTKPPRRANQCDRCGALLHHRWDDDPEAITRRLEVYRDQTEPLIGFFRDRGSLTEVNGEQALTNAFEQLTRLLQPE
jgi:adenylate kinase